MIGYELVVPLLVTKSWPERAGCWVWLVLDLRVLYTAHRSLGTPLRPTLALGMASAAAILALWCLFPDEDQKTVYFIGWVLQIPLGYLAALLYATGQMHLEPTDWLIW